MQRVLLVGVIVLLSIFVCNIAAQEKTACGELGDQLSGFGLRYLGDWVKEEAGKGDSKGVSSIVTNNKEIIANAAGNKYNNFVEWLNKCLESLAPKKCKDLTGIELAICRHEVRYHNQ